MRVFDCSKRGKSEKNSKNCAQVKEKHSKKTTNSHNKTTSPLKIAALIANHIKNNTNENIRNCMKQRNMPEPELELCVHTAIMITIFFFRSSISNKERKANKHNWLVHFEKIRMDGISFLLCQFRSTYALCSLKCRRKETKHAWQHTHSLTRTERDMTLNCCFLEQCGSKWRYVLNLFCCVPDNHTNINTCIDTSARAHTHTNRLVFSPFISIRFVNKRMK